MLVTELKICDVILIQVVMENRDFISLNQIGIGTQPFLFRALDGCMGRAAARHVLASPSRSRVRVETASELELASPWEIQDMNKDDL